MASATRRPSRPRPKSGKGTPHMFATREPTPAQQHEEWLRLLRPDGPFISLPVLTTTFPQGLDTVPKATRDRLRQGWAEVREDPALLRPAWEKLVLNELLGWAPGLRTGAAIPESLRADGNTPDAVLMGPGGPDGPRPRALFYRSDDWNASLTRSRGATPALVDRAAEAARWRGVPLALLTNGRQWALLHARPQQATGLALFDADLWWEEPLLLRSFASLLHARRTVLPDRDSQGAHTDSLTALFARTTEEQAEVTHTLGRQVRDAVALLVAELSRLDRESGGELLATTNGKELYQGALTVMMRLVFLLYAEEQRLLPAQDPLYADSYAVAPLHAALATDQSLHGDELGDRRSAAWPRLLALFSTVHGGCRHDALWIPAYGGSLFDPARFPWLADAKVTDRVVYEILDALLTLRRRAKGHEALSYKGLDVEQIGHVYEGLLEYGCEHADQPHLGLIGKNETVLPLPELESWAASGPEVLRQELRNATGATPTQLEKALLSALGGQRSLTTADLDAACDNDEDLAARVTPFAGLLRPDLREQPMVFPAGSSVMVRVGDRRSTGTHYTPKELAEEIVTHTLAPLCHSPGPAQGVPEAEWRVKRAGDLLSLRVLDPAMGSGAFLVSACRYLAERVVDAWQRDGLPEEMRHEFGDPDRDELLTVARRLVADRCLYGVDRDPMAVELAKLSLWLVTLAKGRPFSFLDHALRCGDSLVGTIDLQQIRAFHLDSGARQLSDEVARALEVTENLLSQAAGLRRKIEGRPADDIRVIRDKAEKLREAEALAERLRLAADAVVGAALAAEGIDDEEAAELTGEQNVGGKRGAAAFRSAKETAKGLAYERRLLSVASLVARALEDEPGSAAEYEARKVVDGWLKGTRAAPVRPLHWPLEFPEIMGVGGPDYGFDAVVGNPPFIGGKKLTGNLGTDYREYLVNRLARGVRGHADLCAYFLLRNSSLTPHGRTGIIATNTIAQGDTREVGLDQATAAEWTIYRAIKSQPWPGTAALEVSLLWLGRTEESEARTLDGRGVRGITPGLDPRSRVSGRPHRLVANEGRSFIGSYVLGKGFILRPEEAQALIVKDPRNKDVLFPYLNGEDLNSRPDCSASRWVINFHNSPEDEAAKYADVYEIAKREVKPVRQRLKPDGTYALRNPLPQRWWQYADKRPAMAKAMTNLNQVAVMALVSRTLMPVRVTSRQVLSHKLCVFITEQSAQLAILSSGFHSAWAWKYSSTMKADLNYSPSDAYETFPHPDTTDRLTSAGTTLEKIQRAAMVSRNIGLTKLYHLAHSRTEQSGDIRVLRQVHTEVDQAVADAYSWTDLDLNHDFHETRQGTRFTIDPLIQTEILDRLLELNHSRYQEELEAGLHVPKQRKKSIARPTISDGSIQEAFPLD